MKRWRATTRPRTTAPQQPPAFGDGLIGVLLGGDGLRAIAALMIFFGHVFVNADPGQAFENYGWAKELVGRLDLGLGLFFALSGYFVARPFVRSYILATKRPSARRFARNRALRIVPAFYVVAAIVLLRFGLDGAIGPTPDNPSGTGPRSEWWQVLSIFTFTQSYTGGSATLPYGQAWSLDAEVAFYLLLPLAAALAYRLGGRIRTPHARAKAALAALGAIGLVSIYLRQGSDEFAVLTSPPFILYAFIPGIMLAAAEPLHRAAPAREPAAGQAPRLRARRDHRPRLGALRELGLRRPDDRAAPRARPPRADGRRLRRRRARRGDRLAARHRARAALARQPADQVPRRALLRDLPHPRLGALRGHRPRRRGHRARRRSSSR